MRSSIAAATSNNTASPATANIVATVVRQPIKKNYRNARSNKKMKAKKKARKVAAAATNNNNVNIAPPTTTIPTTTKSNNNSNNMAPTTTSKKRIRSRQARTKKSRKSRKVKKSKKAKIRRETMRENRLQGNPTAQVPTLSNQSSPVVGLVPGVQIDIKELEKMLSTFNSKTVNYDKYKHYVKIKFEVCSKVQEFYTHYVFRKLRLQVYQNTRKAEAKMINKFKAKFGGPDEVFIGIGDFEQRQHMKYRPPSIGVGIRKIFRKHGYMLFLIDEHRTSMMCCECKSGENKNFMYHKNRKKNPKQIDIELGYKKPYRKYVLSHGLIRCQNEVCGTW